MPCSFYGRASAGLRSVRAGDYGSADGTVRLAYGWLAADLPGSHPAVLRGRRRGWGVAMDNRVDVPGYKPYRLRADGCRPAVFVAFLDLFRTRRPTAGSASPSTAPRCRARPARAQLRPRRRDRAAVDGPPPAPSGPTVGAAGGRRRLGAAPAARSRRGQPRLPRRRDARRWPSLGPAALAEFEGDGRARRPAGW